MAQATRRLFSNTRVRLTTALILAVAAGITYVRAADSLVNNNAGASGTANFTQSETAIVAFGNTVVIGFNDSGSNAGGTNKFTGFSRSTDGGVTFTDGGSLPVSAGGDAGDPVMARNETTGRIYFATLGFSVSTIQVWRSDDNGATWMAPVNGTPGGSSEDKEWLTVDNFPGVGNGNVYLVSRNFGAGNGIFLYRSTDNGATFGPNAGTLITSGNQGAFVTVGSDHSVYAFWLAGTTLQVRRSTDLGVTFGAPVTVATFAGAGGTNGDMGLTGIRQGTAVASGFRSNKFPHAAVNPISGNIYVVYADDGAAADKADIMVVQSTNNGATWSAPTRVNDDVTTTDQWQPTLAVSPDGSKLGIFYYSRQEDTATNNLFKYYGRIASISGSTLTFAPSFAISETASLPEFGRDAVVNSVYMGDYDFAAATPGAFHVVWTDNRDDLPGGAPRKDPNVRYKKISLGLAVTTTVPAVSSIVNTAPTDFVVNFSDSIQAGTVQAADFAVDGIAANSFIVNGASQVTFHYNSTPVTSQGVHTMSMAAGAILRSGDSNPLAAFSGDFRYDAVALQVTGTVPPVGGTFTLPGPFTYDVNFNEPVDPTSVQTTDLALSGIGGASVTGVTVLPGDMTARFTLTVATEGTLTATLAAGTVADIFGNPNDAFSGNYAVDIGTAQYPVPLAEKAPGGSLVFDPGVGGTISAPGDTDNFTIDVDAGQTISLIVTPSAGLQPRVELFDTGNVSMGFAQAGAAGSATGMETIAAASAGTYRISVSSAGGTLGTYTLQVILNAAFELEGLIPSPNNTLATAQNLNGSFITVQTSQNSAERGAVLGTSDGSNYQASPVAFATENIESTGTIIAGLTNQDDASVSIPIGFNFPFYGTTQTSVFVSSNGLLTFGTSNAAFTNTDLTTSPTQAAIAPFWDDLNTGGGVAGSGVYYQLSGAGPDLHVTIQWNKVKFFSGGVAGNTITFQALLYQDGRIRFNYPDLFTTGALDSNNGASATVGVKASGNQGNSRLLLAFNNGPNTYVGNGQSTLINPSVAAPDYYSFTAAAGDVITLAVKSLPAGPLSLQLRDAGDVILATGAGGNTNLDSVVANFSVGSAGTYYARVATSGIAAGNAYDLIVTRNAAFDAEPNDSAASAQLIGGNRGALGRVEPGGILTAQAVPFAFEDVSGSGTVIAGLTGADDASVSIPIGFNFPFYGANQTTIYVSSNGLLTFGSANTAFTNADLTASPAQAAIAPFWDDQTTAGGAPTSNVFSQVLGAGSNQHLTIQWNKVQFFSGGTAGDTITYQAQLYADGRIQLNYLDLTSGSAGGNNGASATVGVKDAGPQGANRLLLALNNGPNAFVGTGKSTLIAPLPSDDWYSITSNGVDPIVIETSTPGDGPFEPVNVFNPRVELYDSAGNVLIASGSVLGDGRNESINVPSPGLGTYTVKVAAQGGTVGEYFLSTGVSNAWQAGGITLTQESCVLPNAQPDPGERVTASFRIINGTSSGTSNLVATLLTGGGVIAPTGAQTYGAIPAGGQATRAFSFTVDGAVSPNGTVTATLQLQDGATNLGTLPFVFAAGPNPCGIPRMVTTTSLARIDSSTVRATIKIQNNGAVEAQNVTLTTAKLGTTTGTVLPQVLGNVAPGAAVTATVDFVNATPGAASSLSTGGTFTGGAFNAAARVVIP